MQVNMSGEKKNTVKVIDHIHKIVVKKLCDKVYDTQNTWPMVTRKRFC